MNGTSQLLISHLVYACTRLTHRLSRLGAARESAVRNGESTGGDTNAAAREQRCRDTLMVSDLVDSNVRPDLLYLLTLRG